MAITTVHNELIAVNAISGTAIADNAVTSVHIAKNNVGTVQIAQNSVTSVSIALNNVTGTQIAMNSITSTQLADNAVTATKIPDGTQLALGATNFSGEIHVGGTSVAAGTASLMSDGHIKGVLSSGGSGDTLIGAISGVSNGHQIIVDSSNNQTYKWFNGGTNSMILDSSGNVGIGETTPLGKVHIKSGDSAASSVNGNANELVVENSDYTGISILGENECNIHFGDNEDPDVGRIEYHHSSNSMIFRTNTSDAMTLDSSGNVGIGMSPTGVLDIKSDGSGDIINLVHSGNTVNLVSIGQSSDNSGNGIIQLRRNNGVVHSQIHSHGSTYFNGGSIGVGFSSGTPDKLIEAKGAGGSGGALMRLTQTDGSGASGPSIDFGYSGQTWRVGANIHTNADFTIQDTSGNTKMLRLDPDGNLALGSPNAHINDSGGSQPLYLTMHRDAGNLIELSADHASSGELIGGIDFTNDNNADAANNDGDGKLVALMRARSYTDDSNASDDSGGYIQFATKTHGDLLAERMRINHNGEIQVTGQRNADGNSQFAYKTVYYQFEMDSGGTHYLEVPLYSSYSSSNSSGWAEMDIAWLPDHASHTHLHSYKFMWGSDHTRILNLGVISATANETTSSYGPYNITSKSQLFRHPTSGEGNMTYLYIKMQGYHSVNKRRVITLRGVASADVNTASLGPIVDHESTVPVANMVSVHSEIESA